jgi:hypothetical protein
MIRVRKQIGLSLIDKTPIAILRPALVVGGGVMLRIRHRILTPTLFALLALLLKFLGAVGVAVAQAPANDLCSGAMTLTAGVSVSMSTANATSTNDPAECFNLGKGVWFTYTPCANGSVTVKTCNSNFNTVLSVYSGSCATLTPVAGGCVDDSLLCGAQAIVQFSGTANTTYRILAGGNNGASGTLVIEANSPPCNDQCAGAIALTDGVTFTMNTVEATTTNDPVMQCGDGTKGVWFSFTPASSGSLVVSTCGSDFDTVVQVFTGTCGALVYRACGDDNNGCSFAGVASFSAVGGTTYRILAGGFSDQVGVLRIRASTGSPPPPTITTACPMPSGTLGVSYNQSFQASGGAPLYTWSIASGGLPNGLTLNSATGSVSGVPSAGGTFNFTARCLDSNNASVTKSCSIFIWQPPPDLQVTSLVVSPTSGLVNTTGSMCVTIRNGGSATANSFTLSTWFNRWDSAACGNKGSINQFVPSLASGASMTVCYSFTFSGSAGSRKALAFVDSQCNVSETNESNNQKSAAYSVITLPDLTVSALTITPSSGLTGTAGSLCVTIRNGGSGIANNFSLSTWLNKWTSVACGELGSINQSFAALTGGASLTLCYSFTFSGATGTRKAIAFVDSKCTVTETSETNNQKSASYSVFELPDLTVTALSVTPASGPVGTAATLTVTVKNGGKADATNFRLDVWHNRWSSATCGLTGDANVNIPLLAKGASTTFNFPAVFSGSPGTRKAIAFVDSQCVVSETNETNNQKSFSYSVSATSSTEIENDGTPTAP